MSESYIENDEKYFMNTFGKRLPVCFERGEGIKLYTKEGEEYTDFFAGIAVNALGYCHKEYTQAIINQAQKLIHTSNLYYIENQGELAKKICNISCADKVFFANSGAEANEGAIKLAKIYFYKKGMAHKNEIITLKSSFHGRTLATVAATAQEKYQKPYKPLTPGFKHVLINDFEALCKAADENTAAIMIELVQGESGVYPCDKEYVKKLRRLCDEKNILLIADEVQTGIGRTGKMFAYEHYEIEPDIFTIAKALGGGVPIGAVCAKDFCAAFEPGDHGSTFGGNPFCTAAANAVLDIISKEKLVYNAQTVGEYFKEKLEELKKENGNIVQIRGLGLMIGVEFKEGLAKKINQNLFEKKYLCGVCKDTLRILPPLIITKKDVDGFIAALREAIDNI